MPTPEQQVLTILESDPDLLDMVVEAAENFTDLPILVSRLMADLAPIDKLELVEDLMREVQLEPNAEPADDDTALLLAVSLHQGLLETRINRAAIDARQFSVLLCDLVRIAARFYEKPEEDMWAIFAQERASPEVKERIFHGFSPQPVAPSQPLFGPKTPLPPLRLIDE